MFKRKLSKTEKKRYKVMQKFYIRKQRTLEKLKK